jgi:hypothetical protein
MPPAIAAIAFSCKKARGAERIPRPVQLFLNRHRAKLDAQRICMQQRALFLWMAVGPLPIVDLLLCRHLRLLFHHWVPLAAAVGVIGVIALFYHLSRRSAELARAAHWTLLWLVFLNAGTVLTYIAATCGGPIYDRAFSVIDAALGFDWTAWYNLLALHPILRFALWLAYSSLFAQILGSIFWFSFADLDYYNYELLLNNIVSLLLTTAIFALFPAFGHPMPGRELEIATLSVLRVSGLRYFDITHLQGLISFPSYHMVLALLLTYAHRRSTLLAPIAAINGVMLFSIPSFGGHYLVDMIAGAGVAMLAISVAGVMRGAVAAAPAEPHPAAAGGPGRAEAKGVVPEPGIV